MIDLSDEPIEDNINTCVEYLKVLSKIDMTLEIELGITGEKKMELTTLTLKAINYTQPEEVAYAYEKLIKVSDKFTIVVI